MTCQATNGKAALIKHPVKLLAKQLTMEDDFILYTILFNNRPERGRTLSITFHIKRVNTSNNMEEHFPGIGRVFVIFTQASHQPVIAMPDVHLSHSYQVNLIALRLVLMDRDAIEVYTVTDSNGALSENLFCIREGDYSRHLSRQTVAKHLIYL